jgi:hypothetical protein
VDGDGEGLLGGFAFRQAAPGDLGIGEDDGRNGARVEGDILAGDDLGGGTSLV